MLVTLEDVKTYLGINQTPTMVQLSIDVSALTLTRATGSWITAGATVGGQIKTAGFTDPQNNAYLVITEVTSATVVKFALQAGMSTEVGPATTTARIEVLTYDAFLTEQIQILSDSVEGYCGRKFLAADYVQTFYADDFRQALKELPLFHYPLNSVASLTEDTFPTTDYRMHKPSATLTHNNLFFICSREIVVTYNAGYTTLPSEIRSVIYSLIEQSYNRKLSGVPLNFGSDVQRISIPGTISVDFDFSLNTNERKNKYGTILGSYLNVLDAFRSERVVIGSGRLAYVEEAP